MLKLGQPKRFRKGNLAMVKPSKSTMPYQSITPWLLDIFTILPEPLPYSLGDSVIGKLHQNDLVLIISIHNANQHIQYSKIFCAYRNVIGWCNSKFLVKIQK